MKIATWNVNGLRAAFRNQTHQWWKVEKPDVFCLQEIRARPEQLTEKQREFFQNVHTLWHPGQRPGYSGVATISQTRPVNHVKGLGICKFDREGRVIHSVYPDFHLFNVYVPNGRRDLSRLDFKLDFYAALLERCDQLHDRGQKVIMCGDINTCHQPLDLRNPKENENNTGFLPRERAWIDRFLEHGFKDVFRELYPERAEYTWWTYRFNARERNIGWRLDYFLISEPLMSRVDDVINHVDVAGSDHCPVMLYLHD